ncbi:MAG: hypothetical protein RRZ24_11570, partial [Clostridia bacterium]
MTSIKRSIQNRGGLAVITGAMLIIMISSINSIFEALISPNLLPNGFHATLISTALSSDAVTLALPILCALPYTTSFVDDVKSGFIKEYLPRTNVRSYLISKIVACAVSGGAVLAIGVAFAYAMSALTFTPMEA